MTNMMKEFKKNKAKAKQITNQKQDQSIPSQVQTITNFQQPQTLTVTELTPTT